MVKVLVGNPGGVQLTYNGKAVEMQGNAAMTLTFTPKAMHRLKSKHREDSSAAKAPQSNSQP